MQNILELQDNTAISEKAKIFNTRFGKIKINLEKKIKFSRGIIGFLEYNEYVVTDFPDNVTKNDPVKILQSVQDESLSFIILPVSCDKNRLFGGMIEEQDILNICKLFDFEYEQLVVALILNIKKKTENQFENYVNVKAPILIDVKKMEGMQYILASNKYQISSKL